MSNRTATEKSHDPHAAAMDLVRELRGDLAQAIRNAEAKRGTYKQGGQAWHRENSVCWQLTKWWGQRETLRLWLAQRQRERDADAIKAGQAVMVRAMATRYGVTSEEAAVLAEALDDLWNTIDDAGADLADVAAVMREHASALLDCAGRAAWARGQVARGNRLLRQVERLDNALAAAEDCD